MNILVFAIRFIVVATFRDNRKYLGKVRQYSILTKGAGGAAECGQFPAASTVAGGGENLNWR
jgi:hypothetical protein